MVSVLLATVSLLGAGETSRAQTVRSCVTQLSLTQRIGQLILPLVADPALAASAVRKGEVVGFATTGTLSIESARTMRAISREELPLGVIIASDEEGGTVQRFRRVIGALPSARQMAINTEPEQVQETFFRYGSQLRRFGVTMVFGPVVDVGFGPGIGSRAFSSDPEVVSKYAVAVANGLGRAGITPVFKHFPGHGSATRDSHFGLSETKTLRQLTKVDLVPYQQLSRFPNAGVMVGHLVVPGTSQGLPASLSKRMIGTELRQRFSFDGVILSDALGMGAITNEYSLAQASTLFLNAGGTIMIVSSISDVRIVHAAIQRAIAKKQLSEDAVTEAAEKVLRLKGVDVCNAASVSKKNPPIKGAKR